MKNEHENFRRVYDGGRDVEWSRRVRQCMRRSFQRKRTQKILIFRLIIVDDDDEDDGLRVKRHRRLQESSSGERTMLNDDLANKRMEDSMEEGGAEGKCFINRKIIINFITCFHAPISRKSEVLLIEFCI